jgi:hypothetical protein
MEDNEVEATFANTGEGKFSITIFKSIGGETHTKVLQYSFPNELGKRSQIDVIKKEIKPMLRRFSAQTRFKIINQIIQEYNESFKAHINRGCNCV